MFELSGSLWSRYLALRAAGDDPPACLHRGWRPSTKARCEPDKSIKVSHLIYRDQRQTWPCTGHLGRLRAGPAQLVGVDPTAGHPDRVRGPETDDGAYDVESRRPCATTIRHGSSWASGGTNVSVMAR